MRTKTYIVTAVDADAAGVAASQAPVADTDLTLDGTTTFSTPRFVTITATDDFSGVTFTILGQDRWGNRITEDLVGPNNETVRSVGDYLTVLSITPDASGPAAVAATGVLTGTTIADGDTVTIEGQTYTFVDTADAVAATGVLTGTTIAALDTVTIGARTYTFQAAVAVADDVLVGASDSDSLDNLIAAINGDAGEGTLYGTGTVAHAQVTAAAGAGDTMDVTAITAGAAGNAIATTSVLTAGGFADVTLVNGADAITLGADDVLLGASDSDSLDNLIAAINGAAGEGTLYGTGTTEHADVTAAAGAGDTMNVTAIVAGAAGNSIATTSSLSAGGFAAVTLVNGDDADELTVGWPDGGVSPWVICGMKMGVDQVSTARISILASEGAPAGNVELTFDMFPQLTGPEITVDKTTAFVVGTPQDAQAQGVRVVLTSGVGTSALVKVTRPGA